MEIFAPWYQKEQGPEEHLLCGILQGISNSHVQFECEFYIRANFIMTVMSFFSAITVFFLLFLVLFYFAGYSLIFELCCQSHLTLFFMSLAI